MRDNVSTTDMVWSLKKGEVTKVEAECLCQLLSYAVRGRYPPGDTHVHTSFRTECQTSLGPPTTSPTKERAKTVHPVTRCC